MWRVPDLPLPEDVRALVAALREALEVRDAQLSVRDAELEAARAQIAVLAGRVEELERRIGKDSSNSSKPPSSDSPYAKKPRDRSLRGRSGRGRGKQPGARSSTLRQSADPDERTECGPAACGCCGADLDEATVVGVQKRQVVERQPAREGRGAAARTLMRPRWSGCRSGRCSRRSPRRRQR